MQDVALTSWSPYLQVSPQASHRHVIVYIRMATPQVLFRVVTVKPHAYAKLVVCNSGTAARTWRKASSYGIPISGK